MAQNPPAKLKTAFKLSKSYSPIYTGGKVAATPDGNWLFTTLNEEIIITDVQTGRQLQRLHPDPSPVTHLAVSSNYLVVASRSLTIRIYSLSGWIVTPDEEPETLQPGVTIPRAHEAPISVLAIDPTQSIFASGSADGILKVWDCSKGHTTHVLKGHSSVLSALAFEVSDKRKPRLISADDEGKIRTWDLKDRKCLFISQGHVSSVRALSTLSLAESPSLQAIIRSVAPETASRSVKTLLLSAGRDRVVNLWDSDQGNLLKTIPVFESVEAASLVLLEQSPTKHAKGKRKASDDQQLGFVTAGDKGMARLWNLTESSSIASSAVPTRLEGHELTDAIYLEQAQLILTVRVDTVLTFLSVPELKEARHIVGFNDEVVDALLLDSETDAQPSHLVISTNSDSIRLYDLARFDVKLLTGHTDVVLCLSRKGCQLIASGSKDKTARIWVHDGTGFRCRGICEGHLESVGAIALSQKGDFLCTASQDRTMKIWDLSALAQAGTDTPSLRSLITTKIHDKDINALDVAPNDRMIISGSQDKTAKLWSVQYSQGSAGASASFQLLAVFKGHKRGVWSVRFSPVDPCVATSSGDRTVKLWSLSDFACIKTFEGHTNSVLRVDFITRGMQLISSASDGLVKVWNVRDEECVATLDHHEDKIWALTSSGDGSTIASGAADSSIAIWQDITAQVELEKVEKLEQTILKNQDLENFIAFKDYKNAISLALTMDQPRRLYNLFTTVANDRESFDAISDGSLGPVGTGSITGSGAVDQVIASLDREAVMKLLDYVKDWNTTARTSEIAQVILYAILKHHSAQSLTRPAAILEFDDDKPRAKSNQFAEILSALISYTERHLVRVNKALVQESFILDYLLAQMDMDMLPEDELASEPAVKLTNGHA
ncbi:uncharacterized protein L969DRAFT_94581 [Mixia osmundae IAM 14324]|uniref:U3 small nucleolar RNA-associated protein 13 C-terminal domain-containing protein n=1 Tax=Mixia osmundae (strain CBS 9802 / IAM 14324 / JCM 22182 / KY 12970) TaxID=764103 RepID=G7DVM2_MIXOS|nr:uncharacterized protein L969DRAFT_94581 [Mixia osmundae IAM 14324]KEI39524.1 hypothetical protein L969DRAFT_94581 [Mixia osmundae IAM 14324]GAA94632.1 hypothetical protein E5Q_01284 [Mixia osmundae IAM 14324]